VRQSISRDAAAESLLPIRANTTAIGEGNLRRGRRSELQAGGPGFDRYPMPTSIVALGRVWRSTRCSASCICDPRIAFADQLSGERDCVARADEQLCHVDKLADDRKSSADEVKSGWASSVIVCSSSLVGDARDPAR
jgi:hypothetical protein